MAFIQIDFYSNALGMHTHANIILPQKPFKCPDTPNTIAQTCPVLYLLHGQSDDETAWTRLSSIERYAERLGWAVIMPTTHRAWYTDSLLGNYFTYVAQELPAVCHNFFPQLSEKREDTYVAGLSMGGYGAFKCALTYPEVYGTAGSLSGALDMHHPNIGPEYNMLFGDHWQGTDNDLFTLAKRCVEANGPKPRMFQWCGTGDFLYQDNLHFRDYMESLHFPEYHYEESEGDHCWDNWDPKIERFLQWATKQA